MLSTPTLSRRMKRSHFMGEKSLIVVADTSVVINLNATNRAPGILDALPCRVVVTEIVAAELQEDRRSGRRDWELLQALVISGHINVVALGKAGLTIFGELVVGPAGDTLDDGEAATIAYAVEHEIAPVIDERKALRICRERFSSMRPICTVDLFAETAVVSLLGQDILSDAVFRALREARMRVPFERVPWVVDLIGADRAALCPSLPNAARRR
jgi:predicted nucleic acid-binding protein